MEHDLNDINTLFIYKVRPLPIRIIYNSAIK